MAPEEPPEEHRGDPHEETELETHGASSARAHLDPRERVGWIVIGLGLAVIVASVLWVSSAGYGARVRHEFAERRSYNMVKRDVHEVLPIAIVQGLAGLGVVLLGARLRRRARESLTQ